MKLWICGINIGCKAEGMHHNRQFDAADRADAIATAVSLAREEFGHHLDSGARVGLFLVPFPEPVPGYAYLSVGGDYHAKHGICLELEGADMLTPDLREAFKDSWLRNEEAYRYLGR